MQRIAAALLIFLLPTAALAQNPAPAKVGQSKTKWLAIGTVIGGTGLALAAIASKRQSDTLGGGMGNAGIGGTNLPRASVSACVGTISGGATSAVCLIPNGVTAGSLPSAPAVAPGLAAFGAPTYIATLSTNQERGTNWKMIGPAIGIASAGAILLYRDHQSKKRAELSLKSQSAVRLAFRW